MAQHRQDGGDEPTSHRGVRAVEHPLGWVTAHVEDEAVVPFLYLETRLVAPAAALRLSITTCKELLSITIAIVATLCNIYIQLIVAQGLPYYIIWIKRVLREFVEPIHIFRKMVRGHRIYSKI